MAGNGKFINITYPFKESKRGFFVELNNSDKHAFKSDLMHLILTRKGERLYMPDFGTDLLKYIFEPNDSKTLGDIRLDITETVKKYMPNLQVNDVVVEQMKNNEHVASIKIDYTVTDGVFQETDFVIIQL